MIFRRRDEPTEDQERKHRGEVTRSGVNHIAQRLPQLGVTWAQDYADLLDNKHELGALAAVAVVAAEAEAIQAGHLSGNPQLTDDDLAAGLALISAVDEARDRAELVLMGNLLARGWTWTKIARIRRYKRPDYAAQRYERLLDQFPTYEPPHGGGLVMANQRARHLLAGTDTTGLPDYFIRQARPLLASLLYARALAETNEDQVRAWIEASDYSEPLEALRDLMHDDAPDVRGPIRYITEHAESREHVRAQMNALLTAALNNTPGDTQ